MRKEMYHKSFKVCQLAESKGHLTHEAGPSPGKELPLHVVMTVEGCIFLLLAQSNDLARVAVSAAA
jgi:hypothetical protein